MECEIVKDDTPEKGVACLICVVALPFPEKLIGCTWHFYV